MSLPSVCHWHKSWLSQYRRSLPVSGMSFPDSAVLPARRTFPQLLVCDLPVPCVDETGDSVVAAFVMVAGLVSILCFDCSTAFMLREPHPSSEYQTFSCKSSLTTSRVSSWIFCAHTSSSS